jgi:hypothetical protein
MYTMSIDISHYHENTSRACKNLSGPRKEGPAGIQTPYPHPGKRAEVKAGLQRTGKRVARVRAIGLVG